ncbi:MAG TPA: hypothetical protein VMV03_11245 [Spirochaetia bacterium]|nr:hypothetical protein [Spirochaetia bacterium]
MDKSVTVELTRSERELVLNILHIHPDVEKKLMSTRITGNRYHLEFTSAELQSILTGLTSESNHTDDRTLARAYDELHEKLEKLQEKESS